MYWAQSLIRMLSLTKKCGSRPMGLNENIMNSILVDISIELKESKEAMTSLKNPIGEYVNSSGEPKLPHKPIWASKINNLVLPNLCCGISSYFQIAILQLPTPLALTLL